MAAIPHHDVRMTPAEYLAFEREAEIKHEYIDGHVYAMSGASPAHIEISGNVFASLHSQLRGRTCRVLNDVLQVQGFSSRFYTYPDVTVVCGQPQYLDKMVAVLLNPTVIIEVLSPSTEKYDRTAKFAYYQRIESLQEYLMVAQDQMRIEQYMRQPDDSWLLSLVTRADQTLVLPSIDCTLSVADVYDRVVFDG